MLSVRAFATRSPAEGYTGQMKGQSYFVAPNEGGHLGAPWDPEKKAAPLSTSTAIAAARTSLKRLVGPLESRFVCAEVKLCPVAAGDRFWFYVVTFSPDDESLARKSGDSVERAALPFVVYFDGFVVAPWPYSDRL
jgi:hypothetical protein